jgi:hypothetical protein
MITIDQAWEEDECLAELGGVWHHVKIVERGHHPVTLTMVFAWDDEHFDHTHASGFAELPSRDKKDKVTT